MTQRGRRETVFAPDFIDDLEHWTRTNQKLAIRTFKLINHIADMAEVGTLDEVNREIGRLSSLGFELHIAVIELDRAGDWAELTLKTVREEERERR